MTKRLLYVLVCPAEPDILAIILGVIAGIVGIGLALLLIWKLLATIQVSYQIYRLERAMICKEYLNLQNFL